MKFWRKKALLAKIETTYGTDPTPTGAANAILASNVTLRPLEGGEVSRDNIQPYLGGRGEILVDTHVALEFEVEIAGAGAVDTPPKYGPLLRACGLAETINATVSVAYDPVSESFESTTIYMNVDGVLHAMLGSRGSVSMVIGKSQIPKYRFRMLGLFVAVSDTALPTTDTSAFQTPLVASTTNTPTFTIDGFAGVLEELTIDLANQVEGRFLIGSESIQIVDRNATGSAKIELVALATKDFFALAQAKTRVPLVLQHGTAVGNRVRLDAPTVEIGRPSYEESQGITMLNLPLKLIPNAGDDELKITTT